MKTSLVILGLLLTIISGYAQNVRIITNDGQKVNTKIGAVSSKEFFTNRGTFLFSKIDSIFFETKVANDQKTYDGLEAEGVVTTFTNSPIVPDQVEEPLGPVKGAVEPSEPSYALNKRYNLRRVNVKLTDGNTIIGRLISVTGDSLVILPRYGARGVPRMIGYSQITFVGIHMKGSGAIGALVGGIVGCGLGILVTKPSNPDPLGIAEATSGIAGGGLGLIIGASVGAAIASSNTKYIIDGNKENYKALLKKIALEIRDGKNVSKK